VPLEAYLLKLTELIIVPLQHLSKVWLGLVPLYVSLVLGELYKKKIGFSHAVGNGFVMLWAGLNWAMHLSNLGMFAYFGTAKQHTVTAWIVVACTIGIGIGTIILGFRKKDRTLCEVLGHTRFSSYFLITSYPMQVGLVAWNWPSLAAVLIFALPVWFLIYVAGALLRSAMK